MKGALIILAALILIGLILWMLDRRHREEAHGISRLQESDSSDKSDSSDSECCGRHMICEKTSLTPLTDKIEYYDDEELDRFAGKDPATYTDAEIEELRDVLLTMRPADVPGWARSLQLRHIELPPAVRDELLLIASDLRFPMH